MEMGDIKAWTLLFLCITIQGFFLSFLIISKNNKDVKRRNFFLSAFIALFSLIMLFWVGYWNGLFDEFDIQNFIYRPIPLLLGPFLFFYVKSFFEKVERDDLIHLLPFFLLLLYFIPAYSNFNENQDLYGSLWRWDILSPLVISANTASAVFYSIYLFYYYKAKSESGLREYQPQNLKLLMAIIIFFGIFTLVAVLSLWVRFTFSGHSITFDFILSILISLFIYVIGYLGFNSPALMLAIETNNSGMYASSRLNVGEANNLLSDLISHLEEHRPYLVADYKIGQLAKDTDISSHHISELLNKYYKKSFSDVINGYRIEEAKKILASDDFTQRKISSVSFDVGFSSPSTFYFWFKKLTGTSPAKYHERLNN